MRSFIVYTCLYDKHKTSIPTCNLQKAINYCLNTSVSVWIQNVSTVLALAGHWGQAHLTISTKSADLKPAHSSADSILCFDMPTLPASSASWGPRSPTSKYNFMQMGIEASLCAARQVLANWVSELLDVIVWEGILLAPSKRETLIVKVCVPHLYSVWA